MTEREFRDALKRSVGQTGLSPERQRQVLAGRGREERVVRMSSKMKLGLALALVLAVMLGVTGAVASGLGGVDWNGKPVDLPAPGGYLADTEEGARIQELFNAPADAMITSVVDLNVSRIGVVGGILGNGCNFFASSLEEMQAWVEADGTLQWPAYIPDGYSLKLGRVGYSCGTSGALVFVSQEKTDDNYLVTTYEIPEEHRFVSNYFMRLHSEDGKEMTINVCMDMEASESDVFTAGDDSTVQLLEIPGMENAMLIHTPEQSTLALRQMLDEPKCRYWMNVYHKGSASEEEDVFKWLIIKVTAPPMDGEALLSLFGLTAK